MKVIGIKASTKEIRYAVVEVDAAGNVLWSNPDNDATENRVQFPKEATERPAQVCFVHKEFDRILRQTRPDAVVLKLSESIRGAFKAWALDVASFEAAVMLAAESRNVPIIERRYQFLKLNSKNVEAYALLHVGKAPKLWDAHLIDAVAVALKELGK